MSSFNAKSERIYAFRLVFSSPSYSVRCRELKEREEKGSVVGEVMELR